MAGPNLDAATIGAFQNFLGLPATGVWDDATRQAFEGFQQAKGWGADYGLRGNMTEWEYLVDALKRNDRRSAAIDPITEASLNNRMSSVRSTYEQALARSTYAKSMLDIDQSNTLAALEKNWFNARQQLPGAYAARGLLNSGVYKKALADFASEKQTAFDMTRFNYQKQRGAYDIEQQNAQNEFNTQNAAIEAERAARRNQMAAQLQAVM